MKKKIFEQFTLKNNITLSKECFEYLTDIIKSENDLNTILMWYKKSFRAFSTSLSEIKNLINHRGEKKLFALNNIIKCTNTLEDKYYFLKEKVKANITSICNLLDAKLINIFGILYVNKNNEYILEDESDYIVLDFETYSKNMKNSNIKKHNETILYPGMFVCFQGMKLNNIFNVSKIILPAQNILENKCNVNLETKDINILIFYAPIELHELRQIISAFEVYPEIVVINIVYDDKFNRYIHNLNLEFENLQFILMPCYDNRFEEIMPKVILDESPYKNIHFASNPCEILLYNRKIILISDYLVLQTKEKGIFFGNDFYKMFSNSIISQFTYNSIKMPNHYYQKQADTFIILEKDHNHIDKLNDKNFVIFGHYFENEKSFLFYDSFDNTIEFCNY